MTETDGFRIGEIGDAGDLTDERTIKAAQARLRALSRDLRSARASGQASAAVKIQSEQMQIKRYLCETVDRRGRPRKAEDPEEKARINIQRLIRRAIEKIGDKHPALGAHLMASVRTGGYCIYDPYPSERVAWTC